MSDYLWDKTGEVDEDVERLESLLGELRHAPRPLELMAEIARARAQVQSHALHARLPSSTRWLAVAAALLIAFVAGALLLLRAGALKGTEQSASKPPQENSQTVQPQNPASRTTPSPQVTATVARENEKHDEQVVKNALNNGAQVSLNEKQLAFVAKRQPPQPPRVAHVNEIDGGVTRAAQATSFDNMALRMKLAAKEQLVYALRLTSSKLRDVREKTQGVNGAKQSFVEDNRNK